MEEFLLDPTVTFLNHGSFGALPRSVFEVQDALRREMELDPVEFLDRRFLDRVRAALGEVAPHLGAAVENLGFVRNATEGVATVLTSLEFQPGDEILTTNHRYGAVANALRRRAAALGATVREAEVPFPIASPAQVVEAVRAAWTDRTRLLLVDHITSPTALIFPVAELAALARERGVPIFVDGAHVPGHLPVALDEQGLDFWTGNLHKWAFAPRGTAVLWVHPRWRDQVHALVTSHWLGRGLHAELHWTGTFDPTPWLAAPAGLRAHARLGGQALAHANHALVREARQVIAQALGTELPHPDDPAMYGNMATIPLPVAGDDLAAAAALHDALRDRYRIQVPIVPWGGRTFVRVSGQAYNRPAQYVQLADALRALLG